MTWRELWQSTVTNLRALLGFSATPPPAPPKSKPHALTGPVMPSDTQDQPDDQNSQAIDVTSTRTVARVSRPRPSPMRTPNSPPNNSAEPTSTPQDASAAMQARQRRWDEIPPSQLLAAAMSAAPAYKHETEKAETHVEAHSRDDEAMAADATLITSEIGSEINSDSLGPEMIDSPDENSLDEDSADEDSNGIPARDYSENGHGANNETNHTTRDEASDALALTTLLESLLFVAAEPVEPNQLARTLSLPLERIEQGLAQLAEFYQQSQRGVRVQRFKEKVQLVTAPTAAPYIEIFLNLDNTTRLSGPALETLAIIAYRQPVTRSQIEAVRGVDCAGVLRSLTQRGLIADIGRAEGLGRPILYGVTELFMQHFGLVEMNDLPPLEETEADRLWAATVLEEQEIEGERLTQNSPGNQQDSQQVNPSSNQQVGSQEER